MNELPLDDRFAIPFSNVVVKYSLSEYSKGDHLTPPFGGEIEYMNVVAIVKYMGEISINDHPDVMAEWERIKEFIYKHESEQWQTPVTVVVRKPATIR